MRYLAFALLVLLSFASSAAVYKWTDKDGKVHYSDRPTSGQSSVEMDVEDTGTAPTSTRQDQLTREQKRERLLQSMAEDRIEKQEQRERQRAIKQQNRQKCNRYRDQMRHYQRANRLYKLDEDGNRVYISDSDRAQATQNLQRKIKKYCN